MNSFQTIDSGQPELKDDYESAYEAIRRRRKKNLEKYGVEEDEKIDRDEVPSAF